MMDSLIGAPPPIEGPAPDETIHKLASGKEFLYPQAGPESVLDGLPVDRNVKADAWDAYHASPTPEDFKRQFDALHALPPIAKAQLFDLKFKGKPIEPAFPPDAQTGLLGAPKPIEPAFPADAQTGVLGGNPDILPGSRKDLGGGKYQYTTMTPPGVSAPPLPAGLHAPAPVTRLDPKSLAEVSGQIAAHPPGPQYSAFPWIQRRGSPPLPSRSAPELAPELQGKPDPLAAHPVQSGIGAALNLDPTGILPGTAQAVQGLVKAGTPSSTMRERAGGLHDALSGAMEAGTVLLPEQLVADTARTMKILGAAIVSGSATTAGLKHLGIAPEYADLAGDIVGIVAGYGMHWGTAPAEAKALVEASQSAGPTGEHAIDIDLIDKLTRMASQHTQSPLEAEIARNLLRRKYGVNIPDAPVTAEPVPTAEEEAHAGEEPAGPPEPPPPPEPVPGTSLSIENASLFKDAAGNDIFNVVENGQIIYTGPEDGVKAFVAQNATIPNEQAYTKALTDWTKNSTKAAIEYTMEHPEVPHDQALQIVEGQVGRKPEIEDFQVPAEAEMPKPPKPEKPPKPAKPEKPADPKEVGQTAGIPTEPESPETYAIQLQQLREGTRKVVMFPGGQGMPDLTTLEGFSITHDEVTAPDGSKVNNVYVYRKGVGPGMVEPGEIKSAAKHNTLPELLGHTELGMGAPDKTALKGEPIAVTAHAPDGTEVQSTATDAENLPQTVATTHALTPPGGTVSVGPPAEVLAERQGEAAPAVPPEVPPVPEQIGAPASLEGPPPQTETPAPERYGFDSLTPPPSIEAAVSSLKFWLDSIDESIARVEAGYGTTHDQRVIHQGPIIAQRIANWVELRDNDRWAREQPSVQKVAREALHHSITGGPYDDAETRKEAAHYKPYIAEMRQLLDAQLAAPPEQAPNIGAPASLEGQPPFAGSGVTAITLPVGAGAPEAIGAPASIENSQPPAPPAPATPHTSIPEQFADAVDLDGKSNEEIDAIADILGIPKTGQQPAEAPTGVVSNGEAGTGEREPAGSGRPAGPSGPERGANGGGEDDTQALGEVSPEDSGVTASPGTAEPDGERSGGPAREGLQSDAESGSGSGRGDGDSAPELGQPRTPGSGRSTGDLTRQTEGGDFRIAPSDHIGEGTPRQKLNGNIEAIRTVQKVLEEDRPATAEEQEKLAKFVGWGGLSNVFDWRKPEFSGAREELEDLLSPEEYRAAEKSTLNAHYTSPEVISAMWDVMQRFGVTPGFSVLEPSMGVGSFFGLQPDALMPSRRTGVELDKMTGAIAKALYPDSNVQITGFEKMSLPNDFFDVAISNVPFGNYPVVDPLYKRNKIATQSIHNYFFVKSLDLVRPGGIVAFITSRYTMDAQDPALRNLLASKANLIGMVRLPNTAFKGNAGTQVVTDVVFLQKRAPDEAPSGPSFATIREVETPTGPTDINEYYADSPHMMLGKLTTEGTQYAADSQTLEGKLTPEILKAGLDNLPGDIYHEWKAESPAFEDHDFVQLGDEVKDGGYTIKDGVIVQREGDIYRPTAFGKTQNARIRGMIPVKAALRKVFSTQLAEASDDQIVAAREDLNKTYDAFVKQHGPLNNNANSRALGEDPDYAPLTGALENWDRDAKTAEKTDIFTKRTIERPRFPDKADTAAEAMAMVLNERGRLDWNRMQELTGKTPDELRDELGGQVYQNPDGRKWETQDEYLSGNVRKKLELAERAAQLDPQYKRNVDALRLVQPRTLKPEEIKITAGAHWIPTNVVRQFVSDVLNLDAKVHYAPAVATWSMEVPKHQRDRAANQATYGTRDFYGHELFDLALNGKSPRVYRPGPGNTRVFDPEATTTAQVAQDTLKDRFREWIWESPGRAQMLADKYNREINNMRTVEHDGSHLTLPGSNPAITLRPHQKNVIWRALKTGNTLLAHEVGAGKTWEMVAIAMESRRLGLARKPMIAVPNHMAEQFTNDFIKLYPAARVLTIGKEDFTADKRKRAVSRIAGGNWDAVIIRHSSFEKIGVSDATFQRFIDSQVADLRAALEEQTREVGGEKKASKDKTVKEIQKAIARLEAKLEARLSRDTKDDAVSFEELGVDHLLVDEAHAFKALPIITRRTRVAGIPTRTSNRATDMLMKTQYISGLNGGGRGVIFATGTPVTNTMAELYNMQRYLQPKALADAGVSHFDAWANMFGDVRRGIELDVSGKGFRENTRFAKFINIPELMTMYRQMADIKTAAMLKLPRPELIGGGVEPISAPASPELNAYVDYLDDRTDAVRDGHVDKREDNMLKIVSEGKKAALDMRLVDPQATDRPDSKVNKAVDNVYRTWKEGHGDRSTQLVFCDLSTPLSSKKKPKAAPEDDDTADSSAVPEAAGESAGFSVYDDMRDKLIRKGIPSREIAFIHDYTGDEEKQDLFDAVNAGRVRVLFGSTEKMGVGTNVQERMIALHDLDAPWFPAQITQRHGRIQRQGNMFSHVHIYQYLTEGSFDAYSWQLLENKAAFIDATLSGNSDAREMEDIGMVLPSAAEFKAMSSGNPLIKEKIGTDSELAKLEAQRNGYFRQQAGIRQELASLPSTIDGLKRNIAQSQRDVKTIQEHKDDGYTIGTEHFVKKPDDPKDNPEFRAGEALHAALLSWSGPGIPTKIGMYNGLELWTKPGRDVGDYPGLSLQGALTYTVSTNPTNHGGTRASIESIARNLRTPQWMMDDLTESERKLKELQPLLDRPWRDEKRYRDLVQRKIQIDAQLEESEAERAAGADDDDAPAVVLSRGASYRERKRVALEKEATDKATAEEKAKLDAVAKDKSLQREKRHREYLMGNAKNLSEAMRIFNTAPESDKRLLFSTARKKAFDARSNPREWRDPRTRAIALKYFHVKPPGSRNTSGIGVPKPIQ